MIRRAFLGVRGSRCPPGWRRRRTCSTLKPIVKAVREGDEEKVRQALLKGENPNQSDCSGQPLLMVAVMAGQIAVVETLLKGGAVRRCHRPRGLHLADPRRRDAATRHWSTSC